MARIRSTHPGQRKDGDMFDLQPLSYGLIMADPPWLFKNWSKAGTHKNASAKYQCMDLDDICAMPVGHLAAKDCLLWLWATNPMLPEAFKVMHSWGFNYVTAGSWVKTTGKGKLHFGTGYVLRSANEPFLIGRVGKPLCAKNVRSAFLAPAREHSRKPEDAFQIAEKLVPNVRRLELFSRQKRHGWDVWGNEVDKFKAECA